MTPGASGNKTNGAINDDRSMIGPVFSDRAELNAFLDELEASGLRKALEQAQDEFERTVSGATDRGNPYGFAALGWAEVARLYALIRKRRPSVLVETGVCNGVSSAVILQALEQNGEGDLYSIDLPEHTETSYPADTFWEGKKGAAVPKGKQPGWIVPDSLRGRWELTLGRTQDVLEPLLDRLGEIDFFLHDSEHSYECMSFELSAAHARLRPGGILASDDTNWNRAFQEIIEGHGLSSHLLGAGLRFAAI